MGSIFQLNRNQLICLILKFILGTGTSLLCKMPEISTYAFSLVSMIGLVLVSLLVSSTESAPRPSETYGTGENVISRL